MKFGKLIQTSAIQEWSHYYIDYKALKKVIGEIEKVSLNDSQDLVRQVRIQDDDTAMNKPPRSPAVSAKFFLALDQQVEKVAQMYARKETELRGRRALISEKFAILKRRAGKACGDLTPLAVHQALFLFQEDVSKLQNFVELNATALRKILKKWDKRSGSFTKDSYYGYQIRTQVCFDKRTLKDFSESVSLDLESLDMLTGHKAWTDTTSNQGGKTTLHEETLAITSLSAKLESPDQFIDHAKKVKENLDQGAAHFVFSKLLHNMTTEHRDLFNQLSVIFSIDFVYTNNVLNRNLLHDVVINGNIHAVRLCLQSGANFGARDIYGRKPIHYAATMETCDVLKVLLEAMKDADKSYSAMTDYEGMTPLIHSIINDRVTCLEQLIDFGCLINVESVGELVPICVASKLGRLSPVKMLLARGASLDTAQSEGLFAVHIAAKEGHDNVLSHILSQQKSENSRCDLEVGWTPLFYAASEGHISCVKSLVGSGADIAKVDESGWIPWAYALWRGHSEVQPLLCPSGSPSARLLSESVAKADNNNDLDTFALPPLELPPPIIPVSGHTYLEKLSQLNVYIPDHGKSLLTFCDSRPATSLKVVIQCVSMKAQPKLIPYTFIVPLQEKSELLTFQSLHPNDYYLQIYVLPAFGSKIIARCAVHCPAQYASKFEHQLLSVPLQSADTGDIIGALQLEYSIVTPFPGNIGQFALDQILAQGSRSQVSSSLSDGFARMYLHLTSDLIPVIGDHSSLQLDSNVPISCVTSKFLAAQELSRVTSLGKSFEALVLLQTPPSRLLLQITAPSSQHSSTDLNTFVDAILKNLLDFSRSAILKNPEISLASFNPMICAALNLKQTIYQVFLGTCGGYDEDKTQSLAFDEATKVAKRYGLAGLLCFAKPLIQVPALIKAIKDEGLQVYTYGFDNEKPAYVTIQKNSGVNVAFTETTGSILNK